MEIKNIVCKLSYYKTQSLKGRMSVKISAIVDEFVTLFGVDRDATEQILYKHLGSEEPECSDLCRSHPIPTDDHMNQVIEVASRVATETVHSLLKQYNIAITQQQTPTKSGYTIAQIEEWFKPPSKGGYTLARIKSELDFLPEWKGKTRQELKLLFIKRAVDYDSDESSELTELSEELPPIKALVVKKAKSLEPKKTKKISQPAKASSKK